MGLRNRKFLKANSGEANVTIKAPAPACGGLVLENTESEAEPLNTNNSTSEAEPDQEDFEDELEVESSDINDSTSETEPDSTPEAEPDSGPLRRSTRIRT